MKTAYILTIILTTIATTNGMTKPNAGANQEQICLAKVCSSISGHPIKIGKKLQKFLQARVNAAIENNDLTEIDLLIKELNTQLEVCTFGPDMDWIMASIELLTETKGYSTFENSDADYETDSGTSSDETDEVGEKTEEYIDMVEYHNAKYLASQVGLAAQETDEETVTGVASENCSENSEEIVLAGTSTLQDSQTSFESTLSITPKIDEIDNNQANSSLQEIVAPSNDLTRSVFLFNQIQEKAKELKAIKEEKIAQQQKRIEELTQLQEQNKKQLEEEVKKLTKNQEDYKKVMAHVESLEKKSEKISEKELTTKSANGSCTLV